MTDFTENLCVETDGSGEDWARIYEGMLSEDEIFPVEGYRVEFADGDARIWETEQDGETICFSIVDVIDERHLLLAYLGTRENLRSRGIGSRHLAKLLDTLKMEYSGVDAIFVDIEDARQPGIDEEDRAHRQKRERFWRKVGGQFWEGSLLVPAMDGSDEEPTQSRLLWFQLGDKTVDNPRLTEAITTLYEHYRVPADDPAVKASLAQIG